jgi:hypothetical protein
MEPRHESRVLGIVRHGEMGDLGAPERSRCLKHVAGPLRAGEDILGLGARDLRGGTDQDKAHRTIRRALGLPHTGDIGAGGPGVRSPRHVIPPSTRLPKAQMA